MNPKSTELTEERYLDYYSWDHSALARMAALLAGEHMAVKAERDRMSGTLKGIKALCGPDSIIYRACDEALSKTGDET